VNEFISSKVKEEQSSNILLKGIKGQYTLTSYNIP